MIVTIHQPHFLPWLGYLDRMRQADLFILLDDVQFERQNYQNRVRIKTGQGAKWVGVPVLRGSQSDLILDKFIDNLADGRHRWGRRASLTLHHAYRGARCYGDFAPALQQIFDASWSKLIDLDWALLEFLRDAFAIRTPVLRSSTLAVRGHKSERVLALCRAVRAKVFLGGMGGSRHYLDARAFEESGIDVVWQDFRHPRYLQHPQAESFVEGLSAVDFLFNCGRDAARALAGESARLDASPARASLRVPHSELARKMH